VETARPTLRGLGRGGRCLLAITALLGNGAVAVFCVLLSYGDVPEREKLAPYSGMLMHTASLPMFWGALCGSLLAVLVLPDIADAVRRSRARWLAVPLIAGAGWFAANMAELTGELGVWLWLLLVSTAACALYAVARLLLWRAP
jgi:hypothetical protein